MRGSASGSIPLDLSAIWARATPWASYLRPGMEQYALWRGVYDGVLVPGWALEAFMRSPVRRLLVIAADWCGDAANTVPVLARLAELVRGMELRVLERESFPEVMNAYRTNGTRSIPIAIALSESGQELGHWGPRPAALQLTKQLRAVRNPVPARGPKNGQAYFPRLDPCL